jgi:hypothetical protein
MMTSLAYRPRRWPAVGSSGQCLYPGTGQTETAQQFIVDELSARLDKAKSLGVDAIEFDNVDAYQNKTGLTISAASQEQFDATIANLAHGKGLGVGLKNDLGQAGDLQPYFDFAINEQCWQYRECNYPPPGLQAWPSADGKAVFNVEYKLATSKFCPGQFVQLQLQFDTQERQPLRRPLHPLLLSQLAA